MSDTVKITIDGRELEVEPGITVLRAALDNGITIPHFCYHPGLSVAGNCRICAVEVEGAPKLMISCNTQVRDGLEVKSNSERVQRARASVLEFLLINHPLDCSVCDKSGECMLQDYTYDHRRFPADNFIDSRMDEDKIVPTTKELSDKIWLWGNRCIHCSRCVRFTDEISGTGELTFVQRGAKAEIDCHPDNPIDNALSANVVDLCPVGALLDKEFLYANRVWTLESRESVCPHCSKGCNVKVQSHRNELKRLMPRANTDVNDYWMCDHGRHNRQYFTADRVEMPMVKGEDGLVEAARGQVLGMIAEKLDSYEAGQVAGIGSAQCTVEDNYALRLLINQLGSGPLAVRETAMEEPEKFKKFTIEGEKAPNRSGALAALGLPTVGTDDLLEAIEGGTVKAAVVLGNEMNVPLSERERQALGKLDFLVVIDSWHSDIVELADAVLPAAIWAEKEGTFVNSQGRAQHIHQCLIPEGGQAISEWVWLKRISDKLSGGWDFNSASALMDRISEDLKEFNGVSYAAMGGAGVSSNV